MRVLVTGAAGFVGSAVVDEMITAGHEVIAVDALLPTVHRARPGWTVPGLVEADVRDEERMTTLLADVDAVCHQAAVVGIETGPGDLPRYASHNVVGTTSLLSAMATAGVCRLVQASSMVVYGEGAYTCIDHEAVRPGPRRQEDLDAGRYEPTCPVCGGPLTLRSVTEQDVLDPRSGYATTKLAQEYLVGAWTRQVGGTAVSLRYHNVYGPRMPRDTSYAGVASMFRSALSSGRAPRVYEDGRQLRDFVHVHDVAVANLAALQRVMTAGTPGHRAYNIASGEPRTVLELAGGLAEAMGGPCPRVVGGGRPGDVRHVVADPSLARAELGFRARIGFDDGIRRFATDPLRESARAELR